MLSELRRLDLSRNPSLCRPSVSCAMQQHNVFDDLTPPASSSSSSSMRSSSGDSSSSDGSGGGSGGCRRRSSEDVSNGGPPLDALAQLSRLTYLALADTGISSRQLSSLAPLAPSLRSLDLCRNGLSSTPHTFSALAALTQLTQLSVAAQQQPRRSSRGAVDAAEARAALLPLTRLHQLESLDVSGSAAAVGGLLFAGCCPALTRLIARDCSCEVVAAQDGSSGGGSSSVGSTISSSQLQHVDITCRAGMEAAVAQSEQQQLLLPGGVDPHFGLAPPELCMLTALTGLVVSGRGVADFAHALVSSGASGRRLGRLAVLAAAGCGACDGELQLLARGCPALRQLDVPCNAVTADGVASLAELPALERLEVWGQRPALGDAAVAPLLRLCALRHLHASSNALSADGAAALLEGLPGLTCLYAWR